MIHYFCPDMSVKSGGIRQIYKHVAMLASHGLPAYVLHSQAGFRIEDQPNVPIKYLQENNCLKAGDIMVIPEGFPGLMKKVQTMPLRRFAFALNWSYIFDGLNGENWQDFGIERVITVSPYIADVVTWCMRVPVDIIPFSLDSQLYYCDTSVKQKRIVYFGRKADCIENLKSLLMCRNSQWMTELEWLNLEDLDEPDYAKQMREASIYLALGTREGVNQSVYEAMKCGTLVAGFNGIGLQGDMVGGGAGQNCILAENGDYASLGIKLEHPLDDLMNDSFGSWDNVITRGKELATPYTPEKEELALLCFWQRVLQTQ